MSLLDDVMNEISDRFYKCLSFDGFCVESKREDLDKMGISTSAHSSTDLGQQELTRNLPESMPSTIETQNTVDQ